MNEWVRFTDEVRAPRGGHTLTLASEESLDPVTAHIIFGGLNNITEQMAIILTHTARSQILNETRDFSVAIYDRYSRMTAHTFACPVLMGASKFSVEAILDAFRYDLHEGDVILNNDPYSGGSHCGDWSLAIPVFFENELVLVPSIRAHQVDGGGGGVVAGGISSLARSTIEESLVTPPLKLFERGQLRSDVLDWLVASNRIPHCFRADILAMHGACEIARQRILAILHKYGKATVLEAVDYIIDYSERLTRQEIASWPDGVYEGIGYLDGDMAGNLDLEIKATVTIDGDKLKVDFTGSAPQVPGIANSPLANTYTWVFIILCSLIDESIPKIEGVWNSVELVAPEGSIVNPREGAASGLCTVHPGQEIGEAIMVALSKAIPEKVGGQVWKVPQPQMYGTDPRTGRFYGDFSFDMLTGSAGAAKGVDGWGNTPWISSMVFSGPEMAEIQVPHFYERKEFIPDSAAPGQWRGVPTIQAIKRVVDHVTLLSATPWGQRHPAPGLCGGKSGSPNQFIANYGTEDEIHILGGVGYVGFLPPNSRLCLHRGGGGGWGDPLERDPEKVRDDVLDEMVTIEGARRDYGVVIEPASKTVDVEGTAELRRRMREGGTRA